MIDFDKDRDLSHWIRGDAVESRPLDVAKAIYFYSKKWVCSDGDHSCFTIVRGTYDTMFTKILLECFGGSMMSSLEFHISSMPDNLKWDGEMDAVDYWLWVADCVSSLFCEEVE